MQVFKVTRSIVFIVTVLFFLNSCTREEKDDKSVKSAKEEATLRLDSTDAPASPQKPLAIRPIDEMTKQERESYKDTLAKSGFYDCCIRPNCNMCLYEEEEACPCAKLIRRADAVCGECQKGWLKGKGAIEGIDPKKVRRM